MSGHNNIRLPGIQELFSGVLSTAPAAPMRPVANHAAQTYTSRPRALTVPTRPPLNVSQSTLPSSSGRPIHDPNTTRLSRQFTHDRPPEPLARAMPLVPGHSPVSINRPHSNSPRARRDSYCVADPVAREPFRDQPSSGHAEKRYLCPECHRPFSRPSAVDAHMPTHTGERPYPCTYDGCPKSFTTKSNMRRHLQSHTAPLAYSDRSPARPNQYQ